MLIKKQDFPSGPVVRNPPANSGDMDLIPRLGRSHMPWSNLAHVPQLLSPGTPKPVFYKRSHCNEKSPCCS